MYALLTEQGTAAKETALCNAHATWPYAETLAREAANIDVDSEGEFVSSENDELFCIICGGHISDEVEQ